MRKTGFGSAFLCAFENGKEVTVAQARVSQAKKNNDLLMYEVRIIPESGELDTEVSEAIAVRAIGKDLMRTEASDGTLVFSVGPFDTKEQADSLVEFLKDKVEGKVSCDLTGTELSIQ